jgi:hypothetical protein
MSRTPAGAPRADFTLSFVVVAGVSALALAAGSAHTPAVARAEPAAHAPAASAAPAATAPYPPPPLAQGFRSWTHVGEAPSAALFGQPAGTHHIWANEAALAGYRSGAWADGAVLVFDVVDGAGERLRTDVMARDARAYAATGGWGYGEWLLAPAPAIDRPGDGVGATGEPRVNRLVAANPNGVCHSCHERLAGGRGFVVSTWPGRRTGPG